MKNFKVAVSKGGKKYTIVFKAETEIEAKERVHKEGYSILSIEENYKREILGNTFIFNAFKNGESKNGKIVGDDIFKIYIKLRKDLEYDVKELYSESDSNLGEYQKEKIIKDLDEEYILLFKNGKKEKKNELSEKVKGSRIELKNFYLKKELEETYKLIDFVLQKLNNLLSGIEGIELDNDKKEKLKNVYNSIIKIKKSTNIYKLKEVGELALLKVGRIELEEVEKKQEEGTKKLLKETNTLLKKIGSNQSFIEKNKDLGYIFATYMEKINEYFLQYKRKKIEVDKRSHSYIKNILFLKKYESKLKENTKYIIKNIITILLSTEKRDNIFIRRKVIKQNITIFKAKEKGMNYSYTYLKKGFVKSLDLTISFMQSLRKYIFKIIIFYTFMFSIFLNINYYYYEFIDLNYKGIFYFLVIFYFYLILYFNKNLLLIILNFVILFFIIIFGIVNF